MSEIGTTTPDSNFIRDIVDADLRSNKHGGKVVTRFPPEPNGYLHIGHAKSICLNFGIARDYRGKCHLRFDDTNPEKEDVEYVDSIQKDVQWLGFDWGDHLYYASDYYEQLYNYAVELIRKNKAYVCSLTSEEFKEYRGVPTRPGRESPGRAKSVEENFDMFARMRAGEFPDGAYTLRARLDMASPNLHMRDPVLYRIRRAEHHRTGNAWSLYPTYDFAHCLSDSIERITHSICTLEFEVHRPLYDWILEQLDLPLPNPRQIEFARLNLSYTVMSKRMLQELVRGAHVSGWDDPRMPTLAGMRRRGVPPEAIRGFCAAVGVTKVDSLTDVALFEHIVREELNRRAPRFMAVLRPLKVVIENYPENVEEFFAAPNNPECPAAGERQVPFSRELYIEQEDFQEQPHPKFFRLAPGREVRLRAACYIVCREVIKDAAGRIVELRCVYDTESRGGATPDGRKVKGTIHWVSARHARQAEARLYDRLFTVEAPAAQDRDFKEFLNPKSLEVLKIWIEPALADLAPGAFCQFERLGYFCVDSVNSIPEKPVFNRIVTLKDSWSKIAGNRPK